MRPRKSLPRKAARKASTTWLQGASWSFTGSMRQARTYFAATLLNNGQVLVAGGTYRRTFVQYGLPSAELYNPSTGTFTNSASLNTARQGHAAALLPNGQVLAIGGYESQNGTWLASAELYQ